MVASWSQPFQFKITPKLSRSPPPANEDFSLLPRAGGRRGWAPCSLCPATVPPPCVCRLLPRGARNGRAPGRCALDGVDTATATAATSSKRRVSVEKACGGFWDWVEWPRTILWRPTHMIELQTFVSFRVTKVLHTQVKCLHKIATHMLSSHALEKLSNK